MSKGIFFRGIGCQSIIYAANSAKKSVDVTGSPATMLANVSLPKGEGGAKIAAWYRVSIFAHGNSREEDLERDMRKRKIRKMCMVEGNSADLLHTVYHKMEILNLLAVFKRVRNRGFRQNGAKKNLHAKKAFRKESRYIRVVFPLARK